MKDNIVVFTAYLDKFSTLSDEQFGSMVRSLLAYQRGEEPTFSDSMVELAFGVAKFDVDACNKRYDETCEKNRRNIQARWAKANDTTVYDRIPSNTNVYEPIPTDTKNTDNDNDIDIDIDIDKEKKRCTDVHQKENVRKRTEDVHRIVEAWNTLPNVPVVKAIDMNSTRFKMLSARIDKYGVDGVLDAIENVRRSDFLQGQGNRGWHIDFGWFVKPNNFPKVYEGNYNTSAAPNREAMHMSKQAQELNDFYDIVDRWGDSRKETS